MKHPSRIFVIGASAGGVEALKLLARQLPAELPAAPKRAAISTIWIALPVILGMLILLALVVGIVYLLQKLLNLTPTYTGLAQNYVHKAALLIKRALDAVVNRAIEIQGTLATIREFFRRIKL